MMPGGSTLPFEDLLTEADFRMNETQPPTSQKNSKIDTKLFDPLFFDKGKKNSLPLKMFRLEITFSNQSKGKTPK